MDSPAIATSSPPWWRNARLALFVVLTLLLWPSLAHFPFTPDTYLDASWQQVLIHAHAQGWQFGRDLIFTWGPWGFLNSQFHFGATGATAKLLWETVGQLLLAIGLVALTHRLSWWRQALFVLACALFNWLFLDVIFLVFLALAGVGGLMRRDTPRWELALWIIALAFLAEFKFTYNVLSFAAVLAAAIVWAARREWRTAAALVLGYLAAVVLCWTAAGQNPDNLVPYLRRSLEITQGYADAMVVDESWPVFWCGVGLAAASGLFVWRLCRTHPERPFGLAAAGFLAAAWFVVWKHGFTRADGHVYGFFLYTLLLALVVPGLCFPEKRWHWFDLVPALCLFGVWWVEPDLLPRCPGIALARLRDNTRALLRAPRLPAEWENSLQSARAAAALPAVRRAVGEATIDVYNYNQGAALLNGLRYTPRPVFQSYSAYTPRLAGRNLRFYQSERAPDFLLWNHGSIDGRYPALDDAALLAELPRGYEVALAEGDYLLLKKKNPLPTQRLARELSLEQSLALGEELTLPLVRDRAVWLQVAAAPNTLGRLRAFLYKPAILNLTVTDELGRQSTWRMLPRVAEDGFLLQPILDTPVDFAAFLRGRARHWLRSLRFEAPAGQAEFWRQLSLRLYALPQLTLQSESAYTSLTQAGITDRVPDTVVAAVPLEIFSFRSGKAVLLHAPGEMTFTVPADAKHFSGIFGLRDGSFTRGAQTDGVEFVIEASWTDNRTELLLRRFLDPVHRATDQAPYEFSLGLPADHPARLTIRTLPGPAGDSRWDWSYWSKLRFRADAAP